MKRAGWKRGVLCAALLVALLGLQACARSDDNGFSDGSPKPARGGYVGAGGGVNF